MLPPGHFEVAKTPDAVACVWKRESGTMVCGRSASFAGDQLRIGVAQQFTRDMHLLSALPCGDNEQTVRRILA